MIDSPWVHKEIDLFLLVRYLMYLLDKIEIMELVGGNTGNDGTLQTRSMQVQQGVSTFNLGIKPKDPPMFHGRVIEDVKTWLAKVSDFFYLTEAMDQQQVVYAATLFRRLLQTSGLLC